ncbi:hypothetical protein H4R22_004531, partial [Coemansia sp. RSA 1290]
AFDNYILEGLPVAGMNHPQESDGSQQPPDASNGNAQGEADNDSAPETDVQSNNNGTFKIPITAHKSTKGQISTMAARIRALEKHNLNVPGKWLQAVEKLPIKEYGYGIEVSEDFLLHTET